MESNTFLLLLLLFITWKILFRKYTITLTSPIFINTETKEIGAWAYYKMKISTFPYPDLIINDGKGGVYRLLEVECGKSNKDIFCKTYMYQSLCNNKEQYEHTKKRAIESGWKVREIEPHVLHWWKDKYETIDIAN